jgi:cytidylate kinase
MRDGIEVQAKTVHLQKKEMKHVIVAIDGHSSCGKSTVAKSIAHHFGFIYVDTGSMYRAVTLFCLRNGIISNGVIREDIIVKSLDSIDISFRVNPGTQLNEVMLNGDVVEQDIRGMEVSGLVSPVSKIKAVRDKLVAIQRHIGSSQSVVMDGRDIGTVVFPHADLKIFMTARPEVRAKRRYDELVAKGDSVDYESILKNVLDRDFQDENRDESPLRKANDALLLDNSDMSREEQLAWLTRKIEEHVR